MRIYSNDRTFSEWLRDNLPQWSGAIFLGLTCFTLTLEFHTWVRGVELRSQQTTADETTLRAKPAEARRQDLESLKRVREQLDSWQASRLACAKPLQLMGESWPPALTLRRCLLSGEFQTEDDPAASGPLRRRYTLTCDGVGRDAQTLGAVTDLLDALGTARDGGPLLRQLELQGGVRSTAVPGASEREFSIVSTVLTGGGL